MLSALHLQALPVRLQACVEEDLQREAAAAPPSAATATATPNTPKPVAPNPNPPTLFWGRDISQKPQLGSLKGCLPAAKGLSNLVYLDGGGGRAAAAPPPPLLWIKGAQALQAAGAET